MTTPSSSPPRSVLADILELTLNGMGLNEEKVKEIVSLAEAQERLLSAEAMEFQTKSTLETILKLHLQAILEHQALSRKVVSLQALARGFIVRRRVEQLTGVTRFVTEPGVSVAPWTTGKIWKRLAAVKELITSERMFVDLMTAFKEYKMSLKDVKIADILFCHVDKMWKLHRRVLDKLQPLVSETWAFSFRGVSTILLKLVPKFSVYSDFIKSFKRTIDLLDKTLQEDAGFAQRLEETRAQLHSEHQLRELFFFPLYRISQYYTQLQTLAAAFHEDQTEQLHLLQTASVFYQMGEYLQNTLREVDRNETLFTIQQRIVSKDPRWNLAQSRTRVFIKEVDVQVGEQSSVLFLFSDILLLCRRSKSSKDLKLSREPIDLSYIVASPCEKTPEDLYLGVQGETTTVTFPSGADRDTFFAFLSLSLDQIDNKVFRRSLSELKSTRSFTHGIPTIISEMVKSLEENALQLPNLFTYYPEQSQLDAFKLYVDGGGEDIVQFDPYVIAFALRVYLSELPEPLLGFNLFDKISMNPDSVTVEEILKQTPSKESKDLMEFVMALLWRVINLSDVNGYTIEQLATEFGYCLLRSKEASVYTALANPKINKVVKKVLEHYCKIYSGLHFRTIFHTSELFRAKSPRRPKISEARYTMSFQVPQSMNAPKQFLPEIQKKTSSPLLPFPGLRMNDTGVLYSYADDSIQSEPFPGIRFHASSSSSSLDKAAGFVQSPAHAVSTIGRSMNRRLSSGTRVLSSSKAKLREVMKKGDEKGSSPNSSSSSLGGTGKESISSKLKDKTTKAKEKLRPGSAAATEKTSPFPGIRMHSDSEKPSPPPERKGSEAFPGIRLHVDGSPEKSGTSPSVGVRKGTEAGSSGTGGSGGVSLGGNAGGGGSAGGPMGFPGIRMYEDNNKATASPSGGTKNRSESIAGSTSPFPGIRFRPGGTMTAEEEQFFKSHPAAFEVGNLSNERVEHEEEKRKSKGMLSGLKDAWRLSGGKSRTNSVGGGKK